MCIYASIDERPRQPQNYVNSVIDNYVYVFPW